MHDGKRRFLWLKTLLAVTLGAWVVLAGPPATAAPVKFAQPFLSAFSRSEVHVIAFLSGNAQYDAVEAFVTKRPGQEPLIRAILTRLDGFQIDHINDQAIANQRAQTLPNRLTVYRPIAYQDSVLPGERPRVKLQFMSYQQEDMLLDFTALFPPSPSAGGLTDPGNHDVTSSLPIMWRDASTVGESTTTFLINGVAQPLEPSAIPGATGAFYTAGFNIGVIRAGTLKLDLVRGPTHIRPHESWRFVDQFGTEHRYVVLEVTGDTAVIRKTTGPEEITTVRIDNKQREILAILSVRLTGIPTSANAMPPPPVGMTLDLTTPGQFTISIDDHANLVSGTVAATYLDDEIAFTLRPTQPSWAVSRVVNAGTHFDHRGNASITSSLVSF